MFLQGAKQFPSEKKIEIQVDYLGFQCDSIHLTVNATTGKYNCLVSGRLIGEWLLSTKKSIQRIEFLKMIVATKKLQRKYQPNALLKIVPESEQHLELCFTNSFMAKLHIFLNFQWSNSNHIQVGQDLFEVFRREVFSSK